MLVSIFAFGKPANAAVEQATVHATGRIIHPNSQFTVGINYWQGVTVNQFLNRDLPLMKQLGVKSVKLGAVYNSGPENNLQQYSDIVNVLASNGFEITGILYDKSGATNLTEWELYVYQIVETFKGKVQNWVVWNEPNWNPDADKAWFTPSEYVNILKTAYVNAKLADPHCFILTGSLLTVEGGRNYLEGMYQNGAKGFFDAVAINPYCYPASPLEPNKGWQNHTFWNLPTVYEVMVQNGDSAKKIWITEFGYRSTDTANWVYTVTEEQQALYMQQALNLSDSWNWVGKFYIFKWMDASTSTGNWGLIKESYSPPYVTKPAFTAIQQFISAQSIIKP